MGSKGSGSGDGSGGGVGISSTGIVGPTSVIQRNAFGDILIHLSGPVAALVGVENDEWSIVAVEAKILGVGAEGSLSWDEGDSLVTGNFSAGAILGLEGTVTVDYGSWDVDFSIGMVSRRLTPVHPLVLAA